jgi:hypothetical protein
MRWDNLFDDLEGQLEQELEAEGLDLHAEEERLRLGRMTLRDRIVALHEAREGDAGSRVRLVLSSGEGITLRTVTIGRDWISADVIEDSARRAQCIVPIAAIASLSLSPAQSLASVAATTDPARERSLASRISLAFVLRDLCRRRAAVAVQTAVGPLHGTIDRVGRDHFDLAVHEPGEPRRSSVVVQSRIVPFTSLVIVRVA